MGEIPCVVLNNGKTMPVLGFGTATYPEPAPEIVETAVYEAIRLGYRHFDTASVYCTERPLGQAISRALEDGLIRSRHDLFITSKLWCTDAYPEGVLPAARGSLVGLGLEYMDLYLVHYPVRMKGDKSLVHCGDDVIPFDMKGTWEAMEECHRLGLAKAIGVSNFTCKKLDQLLAHAKIKPAVNQVEMNPFWKQKKMREFCAEKGIHLSAYSPLGAKGVMWGSNDLFEEEVIKEIAQSLGKSIAQVCLRWVLGKGASVVVKSFNKQRMEQNMGIFDWQLCEEHTKKLDNLPQKKMDSNAQFLSPNGIFKSVEEFWDGEM